MFITSANYDTIHHVTYSITVVSLIKTRYCLYFVNVFLFIKDKITPLRNKMIENTKVEEMCSFGMKKERQCVCFVPQCPAPSTFQGYSSCVSSGQNRSRLDTRVCPLCWKLMWFITNTVLLLREVQWKTKGKVKKFHCNILAILKWYKASCSLATYKYP